MLPGYQTKTNVGIGAGLLLSLFGILAFFLAHSFSLPVFLVIMSAGQALQIWGACSYAEGKGYHPLWVRLILAQIIVLVILAFLPDKHPQPQASFLKRALTVIVAVLAFFITIPTFLWLGYKLLAPSPEETRAHIQQFESTMPTTFTNLLKDPNTTQADKIKLVKGFDNMESSIPAFQAALQYYQDKENKAPLSKDENEVKQLITVELQGLQSRKMVKPSVK